MSPGVPISRQERHQSIENGYHCCECNLIYPADSKWDEIHLSKCLEVKRLLSRDDATILIKKDLFRCQCPFCSEFHFFKNLNELCLHFHQYHHIGVHHIVRNGVKSIGNDKKKSIISSKPSKELSCKNCELKYTEKSDRELKIHSETCQIWKYIWSKENEIYFKPYCAFCNIQHGSASGQFFESFQLLFQHLQMEHHVHKINNKKPNKRPSPCKTINRPPVPSIMLPKSTAPRSTRKEIDYFGRKPFKLENYFISSEVKSTDSKFGYKTPCLFSYGDIIKVRLYSRHIGFKIYHPGCKVVVHLFTVFNCI